MRIWYSQYRARNIAYTTGRDVVLSLIIVRFDEQNNNDDDDEGDVSTGTAHVHTRDAGTF